MDLYEYQGKELFQQFGISVSEGRVATTPDEAEAAARELGGLAALWMHGGVLSALSRRLHLVTLLLVAAVWLGLVSTWGSDVVSWWLD